MYCSIENFMDEVLSKIVKEKFSKWNLNFKLKKVFYLERKITDL